MTRPTEADKNRKSQGAADPARARAMSFAGVYPLYVQKAERKGRSKEEVDEILRWLTGYDDQGLSAQIAARSSFEDFFGAAPQIHPHAVRVTGVICGYRVEDIEDPVMRLMRTLDKLVDELAKGRPMAKVLRT